MTTLFGLRHPEIEAAILVANKQLTASDSQTGFPIRKYAGRKLWIAKSRDYCFGHSGLRDDKTEGFIYRLINGEYDIYRIIEKKYFPELRKFNIERMGKELPDVNNMSSFLLATRFDKKPALYTCFPLGSVQERNWTAIGSRFPRIKEYIDALKVLSEAEDYSKKGNKLNLPTLIRICLEAVRRAQSQDLYSSGLDMMVCTPEGINDHFTELNEDFETKLKRIQRRYR
ncbi:MAG: hypothetical protein QXX68_00635 [Candidatus Pacearchaeota archaeon]